MPAIRGRIDTQRELDVGGITVELVNATGDIVDQVQVNEEGGFVLNVSPGSWKLRGYDPQGQRGETTVSITQDDVAVQLSLTSTQA